MSDKIDLLLVNAGGTKKKVYQDLSKDLSAVEPPFWAALTAGFIRNNGYHVDILDANAENYDAEETADKIVEMNPSLTNIVVYGQQPAASTQLMDTVGRLCTEIKKRDKNLMIILTGLHPSALPEKTMSSEDCDYVAQGEGFYTLLCLLEQKELSKILGLWYKKNGKISSNKRAENIKDLSTVLSDVAWDLLPMDKYMAHNHHALGDFENRSRYASLSTSLGCPFTCTFCSIHATFGERKIRYFSSEWVLKQIDILVKEYNVKYIKIIDELFVFNPKHFLPICEGLIERDYDLNIWTYARVDTVKKEYLSMLRQAGFKWFCIGFESGNIDVRKDVSKGSFDSFDVREVVRKIKEYDIKILANFMFGLPEDDLESMQQTLDLAMELNCEFINFYSSMAYPGSELYHQAIQDGVKLPDSWVGFSQHSYDCLPLPTKKISAKEVLRFRDYAFETYFNNRGYLDMMEEKFGSDARKHLEDMTKVKLKRKLLGD
ncbi:MAG: cobalamin-dependent protein [Candidatus Heimdallarchaeota archaeon]|nr:cobalamin-dependent protein [Candidatus Heimdallarchaeota archaeon]